MSSTSKRAKLSTITSTVSSVSKAELVTWEKVFDCLEGISDGDKKDYLQKIELTTSLFLATPMHLKEAAVEHWGMEGWAQEITETIKRLQLGVPAPSSMTWSDVKNILVGDLPSVYTDPPPLEAVQLSQAFRDMLKVFHTHISLKSEMDSIARVLLVVAEVVHHFPDLKVELQPTYKGFKVFTDILFLISNQPQPILLIEVKCPEIYTSLTLQNQHVAQVLREVHIAMEKDKLPFIFTNGQIWSIGIAEKVGTKFRVPTIYLYHLPNLLDGQDFRRLLAHMKTLIEMSTDPKSSW